MSASNDTLVPKTTDQEYMARALQLAEQGRYTTSPNPRVGCVIVKDGRIVGEGWHQQAGGPHAEVMALTMAGKHAQGATAYVTLEPCSHHGRTPPCAEALIKADLKRVVGAIRDPNPNVSGRGFQQLKDAGIAVTESCLADQAEALNIGFMQRMRSGRPWVRAKLAMSLDGRTAMDSGESQWITGSTARRDVQTWRAQSCAVITGSNSVMLDNPSMNVRYDEAELAIPFELQRQPLRVVIDSQGRMPANAKLLAQPGDVLIAGHEASYKMPKRRESLGRLDYWHAATAQGHTDLVALVQYLGAQGCNEILIESGATLTGAFLQANLIDELIIYCAPTLLGSDARPLMQLPLINMSEQRRWQWQDVRMVGNDLRLLLRPRLTP